MSLDQIKHVLRVFLNGLKNIPQRACPSGLNNGSNCEIEVNISMQEKQAMPH